MSLQAYNSATDTLTPIAESDYKDSLEEISALPTASADLLNKCYLLTANQGAYAKGIYQCQAILNTDPTEYDWVLISSNPLVGGKGITIEDDTVNADTNIFNGTLQEWEVLTVEEKANYSHIATPEEDTPLLPIKSVTVTGTTGSDGMLWGVLSGINIDTILSIRVTNSLGSNASAILKNANTAPNTVGVYIFGGTNGYSPIGSKSTTLKITYIDV